MTENSNSAMNLLDFPLEVLEEIIAYVPDQLVVAQTCKTFYEISCRLKCNKTTVRASDYGPHGTNVVELEENDSLLQSIVSSKRKIDAMQLEYADVQELECERNLEMLLEGFGRNLKELKIERCQVTLKQFVDHRDVHGSFQLDLPKLRKLTVIRCLPEVLELFNHLPNNVLTKVEIKWCRGNIENVLRNQRKIKELSWTDSDHLAIDIRNLQLHSLELDEESYSRELLTGQGSLTSLYFRSHLSLDQPDIDTISTLEDLEHLKFHLHRFVNLSSLRKLPKMRKLEMYNISENDRSLETLKSFSLNYLTIVHQKLDRESTVTLSLNCPKIRKLEINYCSDLDVFIDIRRKYIDFSSLLEQFPNLESFSTPWPDNFILPNGSMHRNLKRLYLKFESPPSGFKNLLECCGGLETLKIYYLDWFLLKIILTIRPNLKVLCVVGVSKVNEKFINTFWDLGRNLASFHIRSKSAVGKMIDGELKEINEGLPYLALMKALQQKKTCCKK